MANRRAEFTAGQIRANEVSGTRRGPRRLPQQQPPRGVAQDYSRMLMRVVKQARNVLEPLLREAPRLLQTSEQERRLDAGETRRVREMADQARELVARGVDPGRVRSLLQGLANSTLNWNREQLGKQTQAALGANVFSPETGVGAMLDDFVEENVQLIRSIPAQMIDDVQGTITRAITSAKTSTELREDLENNFRVSRNRARTIARDQIGKLYGQINAQRQRNMGVTHFIWRDVSDDRVRARHRELDGRRFAYADPPSEGLPGTPIQCRCYAEPDFSTILEAV